jgi:hypothetical protein
MTRGPTVGAMPPIPRAMNLLPLGRERDVQDLLEDVAGWATAQSDVRALALVGSWTRGRRARTPMVPSLAGRADGAQDERMRLKRGRKVWVSLRRTRVPGRVRHAGSRRAVVVIELPDGIEERSVRREDLARRTSTSPREEELRARTDPPSSGRVSASVRKDGGPVGGLPGYRERRGRRSARRVS